MKSQYAHMYHQWRASILTSWCVTVSELILLCVRYSKKRMRCHRPRVTVADDASCYYISRQWMHKFETFADPGPVDNHDFLCQHGGALYNFLLLI